MHGPDLETCEEIVPPDEIWYRQGSKHYDGDRDHVSAMSFKPTETDQGKLSGVRSSMRTPEEAYNDREDIAPGKTIGTWGIQVQALNYLELRCIYDANCEPDLPLGHSYVDLRHVEKMADLRDLRDDLYAAAKEFGCLYP